MSRSGRRKFLLIRVIVAVVLTILLLGSMYFSDRIDAALGWNAGSTVESDNSLTLHFVDVGQADSCIICLPDDRTMIIDGGDREAADTLLNYIDKNIFDGGSGKFDFAVLTHSDEDHCGSLDDVFKKYPTGVFYRPNLQAVNNSNKDYVDPDLDKLWGNYTSKSTAVYRDAIDAGHASAEKVIATNASDETQNVIKPVGISPNDPDYYEINFYTPNRDSYGDSWNDYSPIIILEYLGKKVALSGDAEKLAEEEFVDLCDKGEGKFSVFDDNYTVDVIKLGHHGSSTSSSPEYLEALTTPVSRPNVLTVISCGANNSYGHPSKSTLNTLSDMGFSEENILRTDLIGDIVITIKASESKAVILVGDKQVASVANGLTWKRLAIILIIGEILVIIVLPEVLRASKSRPSRRGRR